MQRFFTSSQNIKGGTITICDKQQVRHMKNALRLKAGEEVVAFDEQGNEYICSVAALSDKALLTVRNRRPFHALKAKASLAIACALPKKSKFSDIVDKLTQIGVDRIIPLETSRTVVRAHKDKRLAQQERWKKVAMSASQQSQRRILPVIGPVMQMKEILAEAKNYDLRLIPSLIGERRSLRDVLNRDSDHFLKGQKGKKMVAVPNIIVLIGPEGDFTPQEVEAAVEAGFIPVTLGESVLRVETAAVSVASFIKLYAT